MRLSCEKNVFGQHIGYTDIIFTPYSAEAHKTLPLRTDKAATKKETNAFRAESSDEVMQAWDKALAETGVNPFPMNRISTALVLHVENGQQGLSSTFVGGRIGWR